MPAPLHLAVALDGAGWHPAAWREPAARPADLFTAGYWTDLVQEAERGLLDLVTLEDSLGLQSTRRDGPDRRTDQVRGRLDAVLVASRVAPTTSAIGLVPTAQVTHTEPFHVSKAIATLDFVSRGRAGWRPQVSAAPADAAHFGRRTVPPVFDGSPAAAAAVDELFAEADDHVEVVRRLWDSWEDDAEIRDVATGRFVDRDKLHHIDFSGRFFSVRGPSIVPRPPQGQPVVAALAHTDRPYRFAARGADLVFVTPDSRDAARDIVDTVQGLRATLAADAGPLRVFADLVVFLDDEPGAARDRRERLDDLDGAPWTSDATIVTGTPAELADQLQDWAAAGLDGFRLRPATLPHDLQAITRAVVPLLQQRGVFRRAYDGRTLRGRLGLDRPVSRYAATRTPEGVSA
ncbi:LLM class flavin-dependent oxidoreductase [Nakamurella deserti]|uniref:LLM class flavin-dependent oxidoreductase n=1 Tax=Nakamurella deserti TaxID=2164074 RepID=UPI000DBE0CCD|nr:LLM class flavin-dependent oxidoreductase [Nakamurella deserti]